MRSRKDDPVSSAFSMSSQSSLPRPDAAHGLYRRPSSPLRRSLCDRRTIRPPHGSPRWSICLGSEQHRPELAIRKRSRTRRCAEAFFDRLGVSEPLRDTLGKRMRARKFARRLYTGSEKIGYNEVPSHHRLAPSGHPSRAPVKSLAPSSPTLSSP